MSRPDEYREFAAESLQLANKTTHPGEKTRLLAMAEAWLDLADRTSRLPKPATRSGPEHPLVRMALGRRPKVE
jgi:hypothetical protein